MRYSLQLFRRNAGLIQQRRCLADVAQQKPLNHPKAAGGFHFQEGDRVLALDLYKTGKRPVKLLPPLTIDATTKVGSLSHEIKHNDVIGKRADQLIIQGTNKTDSRPFKIAHPSLEHFISLSPRTVTPIYSSYGATIVSLLDIHVAPPLASNDPQSTEIKPLEILEAGTGNGGLTLHLARAIAAANPPPPYSEHDSSEVELAEKWDSWRSSRRAIIHTVELAAPRSKAAEKLIKSFRGGLYSPHIDFHSGNVEEWVKRELDSRAQTESDAGGFLDIVILDLPSVHQKISYVHEAMKEGAQLVVWVPQVTQVAACEYYINSLGLPVKLRRVVELGEGISNGRNWDLRFVKTRAEQRKELQVVDAEADDPSTEASTFSAEASGIVADASEVEDSSVLPLSKSETPQPSTEFPTMVCRPMVGNLTMGGGFVGLFRKVRRQKAQE